MAFNEAIRILNTHGVYGNGLADDCVALIGGNNTEQMMSRMQKVVNNLEEWGKQIGLSFNALKTEVIMFSKATSIVKHLPNRLIIGNHRVPFGFKAKYLGVTLDNRLTWQPHITNDINRAKQYLYLLRKAISKKWGPKPKYLKWVYNAIVLPRLTYGCLAWGNAITTQTMINKINSINRLAAGMLSNTRNSTPRAALEVMYDLTPIPLVIKRESMASFVRNREALKGETRGLSAKAHKRTWEQLAETWQLSPEASDRTSYNTWEKLYKVNEKSFLTQNEPMRAQIIIYTDGSKTDKHTGCGFTINRLNMEIAADSIRLPDYTTVYQAEVLAIRLAMIEVRQHLREEDRYIKIFSDSQAALKSLAKSKVKSHVVGQTIRELNITGALVDRLQLDWIKAHSNLSGNERANELARNSVYVSNVFFDVQPPMSMFKREISTCIQKEWTEEWQKNPTCRMTKIFYPNSDRSKAKRLLNLSRKKSRRLIEAITGQNNLHYVQNKIRKTEHLCRLCEEEEETFDHFVNDCPCLRQARQDHFGLNKIEKSHRWTIQGILEYSRIKVIDQALRGEDSSDLSTE